MAGLRDIDESSGSLGAGDCSAVGLVGFDSLGLDDTSVTGFVGSGILGADCKLGEGRVTSGCEVTVELGAVSSLEESVEGTPERLLDLATSAVEAVSAVGDSVVEDCLRGVFCEDVGLDCTPSVALVVDGCVPSFLEEASGFVIILASEESVEILGVVGCLDGCERVEERVVPPLESVPLLKSPSRCVWRVGSVGAFGVESGEEDRGGIGFPVPSHRSVYGSKIPVVFTGHLT
ncbi:hypothetical protein [Bartonella sp. ML70XJBT]|uniref:hypothetical protein n=1 Tax=Bartonella sp. ML70XJBT TaxID=3019096 RepID=UPI0023612BE9